MTSARNEIPKAAAPIIYSAAKSVHQRKLTLQQAVSKVKSSFPLNTNSLKDYFRGFRMMLEGQTYKRTINAYTLEYFLKYITKDFSKQHLVNAVASIKGHIKYYESRRSITRHTERAIVAKYKKRATAKITFDYPDEVRQYREGQVKQVMVNVYERDKKGRKACIKHYGCKCTVCKMDFRHKYGKIGKNFIHVHHLLELSKIKREYKLDPIRDLRPVCPNCHAMIHRKRPAYSIQKIIKLLRVNARKRDRHLPGLN